MRRPWPTTELALLQLPEGAREQASDAAEEICAALFPVASVTRSTRASSLNPEAGTHPVAEDPREIAAAVRAGEACWEKFPYFEARYGERGRRYTASDGAWLAALPQCEQDKVNRQVLWLGRVLAVRGMPRITLEIHLQLVYQELSRTLPDGEPLYRRLKGAAELLRVERQQQIAKAHFQSLSKEFDDMHNATLANVGCLLVSAVADEGAGIVGGVESLLSWLTDPRHFDGPWAAAVEEHVRQARQLLAAEA